MIENNANETDEIEQNNEDNMAEESEPSKLENLKKYDLISRVKELEGDLERRDIAYKKQQTRVNNLAKDNKEQKEQIDLYAEALKSTEDSINVANDEAASLSQALRIANQRNKELVEVSTDFVNSIDLTIKTSSKLLYNATRGMEHADDILKGSE
jgi:chromosome segregation ATPase